MQAIILAGGKGRRLLPYTTILPKPLMPINDMPILEVVIRQLKNAGFNRITMAVGHLAELIEAYFGDGNKWGINIAYSREDRPLGTAGPLALIKNLDETFLVMNGDILTNLNYNELMEYHKRRNAIVSIATYDKEVNVNLGIIKVDGNNEVCDYIEKPTLVYQVSMGIYVFSSGVLKYVRKGEYLDFPDLIKLLVANGEKVIGYHFKEYWRDIGRQEDYEKAIEEYENIKIKLFN